MMDSLGHVAGHAPSGAGARAGHRSWRAAVAVAWAMLSLLVTPAAFAQTTPAITIDPTAGPVGTVITATITGCPKPSPDLSGNQLARLDFAYVDETPANTVMFTPNADGTATVQIEAVAKKGPPDHTNAEVNVSQCGGNPGAVGSAAFTVIDFDDVPADHTHREGIYWLASERITLGCAPQRFCPGDSVTRGQMATFLQRALDLEDGSVAQFSDVPADHAHAQGIGAVARAGITDGCAEGKYCPNDPVSRAQMATFLQRALDLEDGSVAQFSDVSPDHPHAKGIGAIARAEITSGCTLDRYCPADNVTRAQMATFLMRALR